MRGQGGHGFKMLAPLYSDIQGELVLLSVIQSSDSRSPQGINSASGHGATIFPGPASQAC
jgi:hypothetical protein